MTDFDPRPDHIDDDVSDAVVKDGTEYIRRTYCDQVRDDLEEALDLLAGLVLHTEDGALDHLTISKSRDPHEWEDRAVEIIEKHRAD